MNYQKHVEWAFLALLTGAAGLSVKYLSNLSNSITAMTVAVSEMSAQISVLTTKLTYSEQKLYDHESRLRIIEREDSPSR